MVAMASPDGLALQCRSMAKRLKVTRHAVTAWDEEADAAASHVLRYAVWSKGHPSAAAGMEKASSLLTKAATALKSIEDLWQCNLQEGHFA